MSILRHSALPTSRDIGLADSTTKKANESVQREPDRQKGEKSLPKKRKAYTTFSAETRADIGKYAAENGNAAALKKFRCDITDLGESTVRLFKKRYLEELKKVPHGGTVSSIASRRRGRPLALGKEMDDDIQKYIKALRKTGTPINTAVILAAAEGIITAKDRTLLALHGGHIELKSSWAKSWMSRMKLVKPRGPG